MGTSVILPGCTQIRDDWQLAIDADLVLRGQGANPSKIRLRRPAVIALAERAIAEGMPAIRPQVAFRCVDILVVESERVVLGDDGELHGSGIARKLAGAKKAVVAVATLGKELEERIGKVSRSDLLWQLALEGFGTAAIGALATAACNFFSHMAESEDLRSTIPYFPGMRNWRLDVAQSQIFSLIDAGAIGVALSSSFLMIPRESLSMVIGFGAQVRLESHLCSECDVAAKCRHQSAST